MCFVVLRPRGDLGHVAGHLNPRAMASYLGARGLRLFDYARWAEPLREEIRANPERLAAAAGIEIELIRSLKAFRKEEDRGTCQCK